ncbi:uncharacterized protein LOC109824979 isoform X2 [Asparagus officinalis]|uniref:uncharacterized protein LOC109824979 isoform X2 n=1 Tax=Asparagus officinalis TaxID=4686 RepID=UPI00098DE6FB|nr:uncharacterized protein LOC109824979 isoform X2 [Asparagus officinalis]
MAPEEDDDRFIISSLGLGLGLGLGFLFLTQSQTLKPISTVIKLADTSLKIPKALTIFHSPSSPQTLITASKVLIKGFKASSRLVPAKTQHRITPILSARLKAYIGAVNLIRCKDFLELGFFRGGYKISKNFVRVVEGFVGLQLDSAVKKGMDALGLYLKASAVAREVSRLRKRRSGLGFGRRARRRVGIFYQPKRLNFDGVCSLKRSRFRERGTIVAKDLEFLSHYLHVK